MPKLLNYKRCLYAFKICSLFSCQASFPPRNLFSKASRTAVIQEINIYDSACEEAEPCLDIDTDNCIIGELVFKLTVCRERCHMAFLWGNNKYPLATFTCAILTLSINVSNSFWHYFQQLQDRCLREESLYIHCSLCHLVTLVETIGRWGPSSHCCL